VFGLARLSPTPAGLLKDAYLRAGPSPRDAAHIAILLPRTTWRPSRRRSFQRFGSGPRCGCPWRRCVAGLRAAWCRLSAGRNRIDETVDRPPPGPWRGRPPARMPSRGPRASSTMGSGSPTTWAGGLSTWPWNRSRRVPLRPRTR